MSSEPSTFNSDSKFASIFNAALETYKNKTKKDLASHPLLPVLQPCNSPETVLTVLREQIPVFGQSQKDDDALTKWVTPTVNVLCSFSDTIGQGVGLVSMISICFVVKHSSSILTFRHSQRQMQSLQGSAFSSWSVSFMLPLCHLF